MDDKLLVTLARCLEHASDAVGMISADGLLRHCNPALQRLLDLPPEASRGVSLVAHLPSQAQEEARRALDELHSGATCVEWTSTGDPAGALEPRGLEDVPSFNTFRWSASRIDDGEHALLIARAHRARGDVFYRALAEQMPDALFVLDAEEDPGRILFANSAAARVLDSSAEALIGTSIGADPDEESTGRFQGRLERLLAGEALVFTDALRRRDGTALPVEISAQLIHDGVRRVILAVGKDLSERQGAEAERLRRKRSDLLLQRIAVAANEAERVEDALVFCLQEVCLMVGWPLGHAFLLDPESGELAPSGRWYVDDTTSDYAGFRRVTETMRFAPGVGLPGRVLAVKKALWSTDLVSDPGFVRSDELLKLGMRAGFAFPVWVHKRVVAVLEFFSHHPAEPDVELLQVMTPVAAQLGRVIERQEAAAARSAMEAKVLEAQKHESLGVLAGGIAHDFNNLLVGILGNAALALDHLPEDHPSHVYLRRVDQAAERASELANQMLAYSGRGRFVIRQFDLAQLVREMADLLRSSVSKKTRLSVGFAPHLPAVEGDLTQIRQLVLNLITNAAQAVGEAEGSIDLNITPWTVQQRHSVAEFEPEPPPGDYLCLRVTDTGCGMTEETRRRLFEPFFTTKSTGRGLGLAATLGIVRGHEGAIRVRSRQGQGACFEILLPACAEALATPSDGVRVVKAAAASEEGGTVLVVDDEETVRSLAEAVLSQHGFEVLLAEDGQQALDLFTSRKERIGAVVLDLSMPRLDGHQVLSEIRRQKRDVQVILSSGYSEEVVRRQLDAVDDVGFLQKPYRPRTLLAAVCQAMS